MNRLEQAQSKLNRIKAEREEIGKQAREESSRIPLGQPNIIGRRDIYKDINRKHAKAARLLEEEERQEDRVKMLEKVEDFKQENELLKDVHVVGRTGYATVGAKTSVNNLDYFRNELKEMEAQNEKAKAYNKTKPAVKMETLGTKITKLKRKIAILEDMQEKDNKKVLSEKTQELIDTGKVKQWDKKPIYYFVSGLKKVALEIDENGNFFISSRYPAWSENDENFVKELLN